MSKEQIVSDAMAALTLAEQGVFGDVYDKSFAEGVASVPPADAGEQAKIDAAVASAIAPLNQQIVDLTAKDEADVKALSDAQADFDSKSAAFQQTIADLQGKVSIDEAAISDIKAKADEFQAALDKIKSLLNPSQP